MTARVLVVDDIETNRRLIQVKLETRYYSVFTASSGAEALASAEAHTPDIILLDVMMPEMDGYEVCRRLKSNPATQHIPVVMLTALTAREDRLRGLEAGAEDFFPSQSRILRFLRASRRSHDTILLLTNCRRAETAKLRALSFRNLRWSCSVVLQTFCS